MSKPPQSSPNASAQPRLSGILRWLAYGLLWLIPLLFFLVIEVLLRLVGFGTEVPLVRSFEGNPRYYQINPELGTPYFPASGVRPAVALTDVFLKEKPRGSFRIFVLGGSSAAGYPYMFNGSFSSILKAILAAYFPQRHIEVVNFAMTAVSSYTVRDIALQLGQYQPDLLLIYAGHNEFYGGLGVGSTESLGRSRFLINLYLRLRHFRAFQLMGKVVSGLSGVFSGGDSHGRPEAGTLMQRMAATRHIPYGTPLFRLAAENFEANLADVAEAGRSYHAGVFLGTLVSNIRDLAPFVDVHGDSTLRRQWAAAWQAAQESHSSGDDDRAIEFLEKCFQIDSLPAMPYYLRGQMAAAQGDSAAAYHFFYRAKDFDGLRFRAAEIINRRIAALRSRGGVTVVPVKEAFESASPLRLPGKSLLIDHLHPNLDGYILMAKTFARSIIDGGWMGRPAAAELPDSAWLGEIGVTAVDTIAANLRVKYLEMGWPFKPAPPPPMEALQLPEADSLGQLALQFWKDRISYEQLHLQAAKFYLRRGDWRRAAGEYRALIHATPMNPSPYLLLARMWLEQGRTELALRVLISASEWNLDPRILRQIGEIHLAANRAAAALPYLEQAARAAPEATALLHLAQAQGLTGDWPAARATLRRALRAQPEFPEAQILLRQIESGANRAVK